MTTVTSRSRPERADLRRLPPGSRSTRRLAPAVAVCLVLAASCSVESGESEGTAVDTKLSTTAETDGDTVDPGLDEERAYVDRALSLLEDGYHGTDEIDWEELQRAAYQRLDTAPGRAGSYVAITTALSMIGDAHNRLIYPDAVPQAVAERAGELPTVERDGGVLTVTLPPVSFRYDTSADYVAHAFSAIRDESEAATCGWIVDLRDFTGGSMLHPLAVLGPILAGQEAVSLEHPDGTVASAVEFDADGLLLLNGLPAADAFSDSTEEDVLIPDDLDERILQALSDLGPLPSPAPDIPVAVLTSPRTASAGEAVVVALEGRAVTRRFGSATYGVPTGPASYELEDGAVLRVAETRMVDRLANAYVGRIPPDVQTSEPETDAGAWLKIEGNCTASR